MTVNLWMFALIMGTLLGMDIFLVTQRSDSLGFFAFYVVVSTVSALKPAADHSSPNS